MWVHKTIIVADAVVQQARQLCSSLAGQGGCGMYETALSADGTPPATHWISSGLILQDFATMLENPAIVYGAAQQAGIELPAGSVEAIMQHVDVSDEQAEAVLARLGLQYAVEVLDV